MAKIRLNTKNSAEVSYVASAVKHADLFKCDIKPFWNMCTLHGAQNRSAGTVVLQ